MIYLFWSILNIAILIFFLYLFFGYLTIGKKIYEGKFKNLSIAILIIGVVQVINAFNSNKLDDSINICNQYNPEKNTAVSKLLLEDNLSMNIDLWVIYSKENNVLIPIESKSYLTGLLVGYDWRFKSIQTERKIENRKADYSAYGILEWKLLGMIIYSQEKTFTGKI